MKNIPTQTTSTTLDPDEFNQPMDELENAILNTGISLSGGDVTQLSKSISNYVAGGSYYTDSGSANAYVLSVVGNKKSPTSYFNGMLVRYRATNANTGASTVNVNGLGVLNIKQADGTSDPEDGDISTTSDTFLVCDGTNFRMLNIDFSRIKTSKLKLTADPSGTPDANTLYKKNTCKAWINFNGTGTIAIRDSFNVSSIVDLTVGHYRVNFDRDFADTNFCSVFGIESDSYSGNMSARQVFDFAKTVGSQELRCINGSSSYADLPTINMVVFGNQT